jgi:hypothetical protein
VVFVIIVETSFVSIMMKKKREKDISETTIEKIQRYD